MLLAEFDNPEALRAAARAMRRAGLRADALTPFPVPGLAEDLGFAEHRIHGLSLAGGVAGAALMLFVQWWTNAVDYPLDVGGRPVAAWPAFLFPAFEFGTLAAVLTAAGAMLVGNRLPRRDHPVLRQPEFTLADGDAFFLLVEGADRHLLEDLGAQRIVEVAP